MPRLVTAVGAGIYEEFLFRLWLICLSLLVFVDLLKLRREAVASVAVVLGGALFSLYHFSGEQMAWEVFPWGLFVFRAMAGWYLGALFCLRGFGITVGAHALFNVFVVLTGA